MAVTKLGSKKVGDIVKLKVSGTLTDFIIVNQGNPDSAFYDASCNGTWLLMKECWEQKRWHSSDVNSYADSEIHSYLNSTFLGYFEANIKAAIKEVKIPYRPSSGTSGTVSYGSSGLSCKLFLLSDREVGFTTSNVNQYICDDGRRLAYFLDGNTSGTEACTKRIANLRTSSSAVLWWLRSPSLNNSNGAWYVSTGGLANFSICSNTCGIRPALILDSNLLVSDDGSVSTNTAPSTPTSITIPASISGGTTIQINWGESTDKEGNLAGYVVEKSTDGSQSWKQIYMGTARTTNDNVVFGTESVTYRVKAYDDAGLESGWKISNQVTVINNTAPGAPPQITVPMTVTGGGSLVITWTRSTDAESNLVGYILERQKNGAGAWEQVYKGPLLTFTDSIEKGWTSVTYRVRAYDQYNAESDNTVSPVRTVDNNTAPTIQSESSGDLGEKSSGFKVSYTVDDPDNDQVTVVEAVDDVQKRSFTAVLKQSNSFDVTSTYFQQILNGQHTMKVTATDAGGKKAELALTFTKSVHACSITLAQPMEADAKITIMAMSVAGFIPADATYKVEVTNNAKDDAPKWEDATQAVKTGANYIFTNGEASNGFAFNFKVTASRGVGGQGGYITSIQGGFQ